MKLVVEEAETRALISWLGDQPNRVSSVVADVEVHRAARKESAAAFERAGDVLATVGLLELTAEILISARTMEPAALRSLDAIHLASALSLGADLGALVTYDRLLADAAGAAGVDALAPA